MKEIIINKFGEAPKAGAVFDEHRRFRFVLWRMWDVHRPYVNVILLNPSTADESEDDATVRAIRRQATVKGYGGVVITNAFAWRTTHPTTLKRLAHHGADIIGDPRNQEALVVWATNAGHVVAGWGAHCDEVMPGRGRAIVELMRSINVPLHAFSVNNDASPTHPLYKGAHEPLVEYGR